MEDEDKKIGDEKPPIYLIELILIPLPGVVLADLVDLFSLTGVGAVVSWVCDIIAMAIPTLWLIWKGRRAEWMAIASAVEFILAVDVIPWRTVTLLILYAQDKKHLALERMGRVGEAVEKAEAVTTRAVAKTAGAKAAPTRMPPK